MAWKTILLLSVMASAPALGSQTPVSDNGAPPAPETALYCLKVEAVTGTRLETVECWTRAQWADLEVNVDAEWAAEGVRVVG